VLSRVCRAEDHRAGGTTVSTQRSWVGCRVTKMKSWYHDALVCEAHRRTRRDLIWEFEGTGRGHTTYSSLGVGAADRRFRCSPCRDHPWGGERRGRPDRGPGHRRARRNGAVGCDQDSPGLLRGGDERLSRSDRAPQHQGQRDRRPAASRRPPQAGGREARAYSRAASTRDGCTASHSPSRTRK
jgi:hypothetical protein